MENELERVANEKIMVDVEKIEGKGSFFVFVQVFYLVFVQELLDWSDLLFWKNSFFSLVFVVVNRSSGC